MGSAILFTAARQQEIENNTIVSGLVDVDGHLILYKHDGTPIDAGNVQAPNLADASETVKGIVELATSAETITGTDDTRAVTPKAAKAILDDRTATESSRGIIEIATQAEVNAGIDTERAIVPATFRSVMSDRGYDNKIINGDFRINQRGYISGTTLTPLAARGYCFDRWRTVARANLLGNPSAETNTTNWGSTGVTTLTRGNAQALYGSWSFTCTAGSSGNNGLLLTGRPSVVTGRPYTASTYARVNVVRNAIVFIRWYNRTGVAIGADIVSTSTPMSTSGWTRLSVTGVAPAAAVSAAIGVTASSSVSTNVLYVDGLMFTEGPDLLPYIDGDQAGCMWASTSHGSVSMDRTVLTTITFSASPNGQALTLNSGGGVRQIIEQGDMPPGRYILSWSGTALGRIYNWGSAPPAASMSPIIVDLDGSSDIAVEFEAIGGSATLATVNIIEGEIEYSFISRSMGLELALCQRFFQPLSIGDVTIENPYFAVGLSGGGQFCYSPMTEKRIVPAIILENGQPGVHSFTYFSTSAGSAINRNLGILGFTPRKLQGDYLSGENAAALITAGYARAGNTAPIWLDAEL